MLGWLSGLLDWFTNLWKKVPDSAKEKIVLAMVESFDLILREYFRSKKGKNEEKEVNHE